VWSKTFFNCTSFREKRSQKHRWNENWKWKRTVLSEERVPVQSSWNVMAHGDTREGKWRGNWRMEWVASNLTLPQNMVYPALLQLIHTSRLQVVDWTDAPVGLNGLVGFADRRNLVSAHEPSYFKRSLPIYVCRVPLWSRWNRTWASELWIRLRF
jgi:hypothetical protein